MVANVEKTIWDRLVDLSWQELDAGLARKILELRFSKVDMDRMNVLAACAREGTLTPDQKEELETYMRIGNMVAIMQSKARMALKPSTAAGR